MTAPPLLTPDWLARLSRTELRTPAKRRGAHKGGRRAARFGSSLDFSDFRAYAPGDDVRQIDWNVYARTEQHFIKRFFDEREMRVHVALDASRSMALGGKWRFARQLAASFGALALQADDTCSLALAGADRAPFRKKGRAAQGALTAWLEGLPAPSFKGPIGERALRTLPPSSTVLIVITDGLEPLESLAPAIRRLPRFAADARLLVVRSREEVAPEFSGDVRLLDAEGAGELNVSMTARVRAAYAEARMRHDAELAAVCAASGVMLESAAVEGGLPSALFRQLARAGWIM